MPSGGDAGSPATRAAPPVPPALRSPLRVRSHTTTAGAEHAAATKLTTTARERSPAQGRSPSAQCRPPVRRFIMMLGVNKPVPAMVSTAAAVPWGQPAHRGPAAETHPWRPSAAALRLSHRRAWQERSIQLGRRAHKGAMIFLSHRITPNSPCSVFVTTDYFSRTRARNESGHH